MEGANWDKSKYFGMKKEEIVKKWLDEGAIASAEGNILHNDVNLFYNKEKFKNTSVTFEYFRDFDFYM